MENTTFDNKFVNFSPKITKFGMLIDIIAIDNSHDFGCYGNNYLVTKMHVCITLERSRNQHSDKVCGVCIISWVLEL